MSIASGIKSGIQSLEQPFQDAAAAASDAAHGDFKAALKTGGKALIGLAGDAMTFAAPESLLLKGGAKLALKKGAAVALKDSPKGLNALQSRFGDLSRSDKVGTLANIPLMMPVPSIGSNNAPVQTQSLQTSA